MKSKKNPQNQLIQPIKTAHLILAGLIIALIEILVLLFTEFPKFIDSSEKLLFFLGIFGLTMLFSLIFTIVWKTVELLIRITVFKMLGTNRDKWRSTPHHLIITTTWIFAFISYFFIKFFIESFHDINMITFSLAAILSVFFIAALFVISLITSEQKPITDSQKTFSIKLFDFILSPYILSILLIGILIQINYSWLHVVIDFNLLLEILGLLALTYILGFLSRKRFFGFINSRSFRAIIVIFAVILLIGTICTINYSQNLKVSIQKTTHIPSYTLKYAGNYSPLNRIPTIIKASIEEGKFDLASYLESKTQDYPYDDRSIRDIIGDTSDWNVIVLSIDAVRADHLSCYGYQFPTTPNLDKFAENGVLFERNFIQGGDSPNSINSFMSGIDPVNFRQRRTKMLKDILKDYGFVTGFVGYDALFKGHPFRQNYDDLVLFDTEYDKIWRIATSKQMIDGIMSMISRHKNDRFFIYSHLLDPHSGYINNPETANFRGSGHARYDGEIAHTDTHLGRLFDFLEDQNLMKRTLVIITADHGEEFNDHGNRWHGKFLYNESMRTPMIANYPHLKGRRVKIPVGSVDLVPTVLDFLNIQADPPREGNNLLPLIYHGDSSGISPVFSKIPNSTYRKFGILYGPWKLIYNRGHRTFEFYNIDDDFGETLNLVDRYIYLASNHRDLLADHFPKANIPLIDLTMMKEETTKKIQDTKAVKEKKKIADKTHIGKKQPTAKVYLNEPRDVNFGPEGKYAVADFRNYRVAIFDAKGKLISQFGEMGSKPGYFNDLSGIDFTDDGFIYVADTFNHRVQKFSADGKLIWVASYRFNYPRALVAVPDGVWVTNYGQHQLVKIDSKGKFVKALGHIGNAQDQFIKPVGITVDKKGNLFVADKGNKRIQMLSETGNFIKSIAVDGWQEHTFNFPYLCFDHLGQLYATDPPNHRILVFDPATGSLISQYPPATSKKQSPFMYPMGIDYDTSSKQFVVSDCRHNRIIPIMMKSVITKE